MKIKKLGTNAYEVKEATAGTEQTSNVDKILLMEAIEKLKLEIVKKNELLTYKENLLKEINKL